MKGAALGHLTKSHAPATYIQSTPQNPNPTGQRATPTLENTNILDKGDLIRGRFCARYDELARFRCAINKSGAVAPGL